MLLEGERVRVVVRPSGTEPKLKCYLQVRLRPQDTADPARARTQATLIMGAARAEVAGALGL